MIFLPFLLQVCLHVYPLASAEKLARYDRNILWVGGEYKQAAGGTILTNRQYVEELLPISGAKVGKSPVVMFPGGLNSGAQWLDKPDGDPGWASYFLNKGHPVYLVDTWSVGRSTSNTPVSLGGTPSTELIELAFTAPELSNKYYQSKFHTQWPGRGTRGDPIFDRFYASLLPGIYDATQQDATRSSTCALLSQIKARGPAILVSHSIGASVAFVSTDKCPEFVSAHVTIEADTTPFVSDNNAVFGTPTGIPTRAYGIADIPLTYDPPISSPSDLNPITVGTTSSQNGLISSHDCVLQNKDGVIHKLKNIAKAPVLFLTGEGSVHAVYDRCLVDYLKQTGVSVDWVVLADRGIKGNGHFMMLEKNSDQIADLAYKWIGKLKTTVVSE